MKPNRRDFVRAGIAALGGASAMSIGKLLAASPSVSQRPNVLFIIMEDWGPYLGCYGVNGMSTPNLDQLAAEGVRFNNCFASAPVCSVARSALMTGVTQYTTHSEQHRTASADKKPLPPGVKTMAQLFREAGYYTALGCGYSNKTDLGYVPPKNDYMGDDWGKRAAGQPFFAHLTLTYTHRGWKRDAGHPVDPAKVGLPPWYPDTPMTRADWAMGLESAQISDQRIGEIVARLKKEGLYGDTAIVISSDHGIALPRGKQFLYDEGLHLPLIIRWPSRAKPGAVNDDLVSSLDILPALLGIAGLPIPKILQGRDLFDPATAPRRFVFAARDKMDNTHDAMRAARSKDFKYILNLMPERAYCQFNDYKERSYPGLALLNVLHLEGKLPPEQDAFMQPQKPKEELYDLGKDPHEIHNVANDPAYAASLRELRAELDKWRASVGDPGVTEEFRAGGWPSSYPTRTLEEWKGILAQWEDHILRDGPSPKISSPMGLPAKTRRERRP